MRKLLVDQISLGVGMPIKSGTLGFLQYAYGEMIAELLQELHPNSTLNNQVSAVRGAGWSGSTGNPYTLNSGAVFVGGGSPAASAAGIQSYGELFLIVGNTVSSFINFPILKISTAYFSATNADPVLFNNGGQYNVHAIRTLVLADGDVDTTGFVGFVDPNNNPGSGNYLKYSYTSPVKVFNSPTYNVSGFNNPSGTDLITLTPSAILNSNSMTITFNTGVSFQGTGQINFVIFSGPSSNTHLNNLKTVVVETDFGWTFPEGSYYNVSATSIVVVPYTAGDIVSVFASSNTPLTLSGGQLICEFNDGYH